MRETNSGNKLFIAIARACLFSAALLSCQSVTGGIAFAQQSSDERLHDYIERFESPGTCLVMHRPDSRRFEVLNHSRTDQTSHSGQASEFLRYSTSLGTNFYYRYSIKPAHLIAEFSPSVWVKATQPGIQLLVRVVLPNTKDPNLDGPMTALLSGPMYRNAGHWQRLSFSNLEFNAQQLLNHQAVILGRKYEMAVDTRGAYVDALFLNMYTSAGLTMAWIDDLEIQGAIPLEETRRDSVANVSLATSQELTAADNVSYASAQQDLTTDQQVSVSGRTIFVDGRPFFPRIIQHRGETFETLRQAGFNTIMLSGTANQAQLDAARQSGLWIICPPPPSFDVNNNPGKYDQVLAWSLGKNLTSRDLEIARQKASVLQQTDPLNRPVVCLPSSRLAEFARFCDLLIVDLQPIGTSFDVNQIQRWMQQRQSLAARTLPILMTVQTEFPQVLEQQIAAFDGQTAFLPIEHNQLKHLVWNAISCSDGLLFEARRSLEASDPQSRFRAKMLGWMNGQLRQLEPWLAGGAYSGRLHTDLRDVDASVIETHRSRLILLTKRHDEDSPVGVGAANSVTVTDPRVTASSRAFQITETGFTPIVHQQNRAGMTMRVDNFAETAAVVVTEDALTIKYLHDNQTVKDISLFDEHRQLTAGYLTLINFTIAELHKLEQGSNPALANIENVIANLAQAEKMFKAGDRNGAEASLQRADRLLHSAWQGKQLAVRKQFSSSTASPLIGHFTTLPAHFRAAERLKHGQWSNNILPGGDFELFRQLKESGWKQVQNDHGTIKSSLVLTDEKPVAGESALHLRAWDENPAQADALIESAPAWVTTAPVKVSPGQIIRAHGWVKINHEITGSLDGFMIIDSIGGPPLAARYIAEKGWQEFSLYRVATSNEPFTLTFTLTGLGEAVLDEISVRAFEPSADSAVEHSETP